MSERVGALTCSQEERVGTVRGLTVCGEGGEGDAWLRVGKVADGVDGATRVIMGVRWQVGTGGTLTGSTKFLKSKNKDLKTLAVEPEVGYLSSPSCVMVCVCVCVCVSL